MSISNAVSLERVSKVVGYKLTKGDFRVESPNLPQRIALLGEANTDNQATLDLTGKQITSSKQAGDLYGYGSPIHSMMRILKPISGDGIGGIPIIVYPQLSDGGAIAAKRRIAITGTATKNITHTVIVNNRESLDGKRYDFSVITGDTDVEIVPKIVDAINNVLGCPGTAADILDVDHFADITAKWKGVTSEELSIEINTNGDDAGLTYAISSTATGSGVVDISGALAQFNNDWNTIVINPYGTSQHSVLEAFNGKPTDTPTGRYSSIIFKPFFAIWGSKLDTVASLTAITDTATAKLEVTNILAPAPKSKGFSYEAAANGAYLLAIVSQNTPHLDVSGKSYPDMPVPSDGIIGDMSDYDNRDLLAQSGCSTVDLINGVYQIKEFVTTYHPDGETPPQFRYTRSLVQDFNVYYGYYLSEAINVVDHSVAENNQTVTVSNTIKPKQWIQILNSYADELATRGLIVDPSFMKSSIEVATSEVNPDRLETFFRYKRSPYIRIASTTAEAGFAFGLR